MSSNFISFKVIDKFLDSTFPFYCLWGEGSGSIRIMAWQEGEQLVYSEFIPENLTLRGWGELKKLLKLRSKL